MAPAQSIKTVVREAGMSLKSMGQAAKKRGNR
jgi:hypothetical protein